MEKYSVIAEQENCTVVGHYEAQPRQQTAYQSETASKRNCCNSWKARATSD